MNIFIFLFLRVKIISVGNYVDFNPLKKKNENIHVFKKVDQKKILEVCDLMINHGGINSVLECIYNEIPQLIYPLNYWYDQYGNAARVKYHKVGEVGRIRVDNERKIYSRIVSMLHNKSYKINLRKLKNVILDDDKSIEIASSFLGDYLSSFDSKQCK
jgi:UDP:flavonoid glycosyltransferase YjiC (YdhE family)